MKWTLTCNKPEVELEMFAFTSAKSGHRAQGVNLLSGHPALPEQVTKLGCYTSA